MKTMRNISPSPRSNLISLLGAFWFSAVSAIALDVLDTVSVASSNEPSAIGAGGDSYMALMTPDGRYVLFASTAGNLVSAGDGSPYGPHGGSILNLFCRDRSAAETRLVSVGMSGLEHANSNAFPQGLSTNGQVILFQSAASNLVPDDTNQVSDVFLRDIGAGTTTLVSVGTNGTPGNGPSSNSAMTPDGRYVAFASAANNLVQNDTNRMMDVFIRDMLLGTTRLVSSAVPPRPTLYTNVGSDYPQISADGGRVAFLNRARNRNSGQLTVSLYIWDFRAGTLHWASEDAATAIGVTGSAEVTCYAHELSADGECVAYAATTTGSQIAPAAVLRYRLAAGFSDILHKNAFVPMVVSDTSQTLDISSNGSIVAYLARTNTSASCVHVWNASTGESMLASGNLTNAVTSDATCHAVRLDSQGRSVSFISSAKDLVTNNVTGDYHLYRRDLVNGTTEMLDRDKQAGGWPLTSFAVPSVSEDGRFVAFDAIRPEFGGNAFSQVYVVDAMASGYELVSERANGLTSATGAEKAFTSLSALSDDGSVCAFASDAGNLLAGDTNGVRDVFARDMASGATIPVSFGVRGDAANGASNFPILSPSGRYVVFSSAATNIVGSDTNVHEDVFLHDLQYGETRLASVAFNGAAANSNSTPLGVSGDGRYVLFRSSANNLASGSLPAEQFYLRDMEAATNYALTSNANPLGGAALTPDGRYGVYSFSAGSSYVSLWDTQEKKAVFSNSIPASSPQVAVSPSGSHVCWLSNNAGVYSTILQNVSTGARATIANSASRYASLQFSRDNNWLVHVALVQGTNQVYLQNVEHGTNMLVSHSWNSVAAAFGNSDCPSVSGNGRFVAFRSFASNISAQVGSGGTHIYLFDRTTGQSIQVSRDPNSGASGNGFSVLPSLSADGRTIVFVSFADNLAALDFNQRSDVLAYRIIAEGPSFYLQSILSGGVPTIIWPTTAGGSYKVQFKDDISRPGWQDAVGSVTVIGSQGYYTDPQPSEKRFFRVVATE